MNSGEVQFGYISILLSLLIGIFCLRKIRSYDVHEKEPLLTLGLVVVYGGLASILITTLGYLFIGFFTKVDYSQWFWYVVIVGPLEEGCKLLAFLATLRVFRRHMGDPLDGLVYMSAVALGFSLIENFTYANTGNSTEHLLFVRVALSTPAHILSSLPIGLAGYLAFRGRINSWWMLPAFLAASFIHGLYDILCTVNGLLVVLYLACLWVLAVSVLRYLNIRSPYRKSLREFIAASEPLAQGDMVCMVCEDGAPKRMYQEGELRFQQCQVCGHFLVTRENAFRIFHRFAPEFKNLEGRYGLSESNEGLYALYDVIQIDDEKRVGYFDLEEVDSKLVEIAARIRGESEQKVFLRHLSSVLDSVPPEAHPLRGARRVAMEVALLLLGLMGVGVAGIFHLRKMELPVLNPDALEDWEGRHLQVSVPKQWKFEYRKDHGDSQEVVSFTSQQQVGLVITYQCWSVLLREITQKNLDKFNGLFAVPEISRDTLEEWGEYKGFGIRTTYEDKQGQQFQLTVFSFSDKDQSMVITEVGSKKALEALEANMGFVRKSLKLTSSCREDSEKPVLNLDSSSKANLDSLFKFGTEGNDKP